jgi:hypothetical protein
MNNTIQTVRHQLKEASDEKTKLSGLRFFKEKVELYGVASAVVGKIAKANFEIQSFDSGNVRPALAIGDARRVVYRLQLVV